MTTKSELCKHCQKQITLMGKTWFHVGEPVSDAINCKLIAQPVPTPETKGMNVAETFEWLRERSNRLSEVEEENMRLHLEIAQLRVKPIVDAERESEDIGDLMQVRLNSPAPESVVAPVDSDAANEITEWVVKNIVRNYQLDISTLKDVIAASISAIIRKHSAPVDEVSAALAELREMFPGEVNLGLGITRTGGDGYVGSHGRLHTRKPHYSIHRRVFDNIGSGATLSEAMQRVREWKEQEAGK